MNARLCLLLGLFVVVTAGFCADTNQLTGADARIAAQDRAQELMGHAQSLMNNGRFAAAAGRLSEILRMEPMPGMTEMAQRMRDDCQNTLQQQQKNLETEVATAEKRLNAARQAAAKAQTDIRNAQNESFRRKSSGKMGNDTGPMAAAVAALGAAQTEVSQLNEQLPVLRAQLADVKQALTLLPARAVVEAVAPPPAAVTTPLPAPAPRAEEPDVLTQTARWAQKYWLVAAGVFLFLLWFVSRSLGR